MGAERSYSADRMDALFRSVLGRFFTIPARQPAAPGVSFAQLRLLWVLETRGPSCPYEIARILGVSRPTVTELSDRLAEEGYIARARSADDRRSVILSLRARGRTLLAQIARGRRERFRKILGSIDRTDAARMGAALETLERVLHKWNGE
jgi:DNA-binding MarR family transcriptional regulator